MRCDRLPPQLAVDPAEDERVMLSAAPFRLESKLSMSAASPAGLRCCKRWIICLTASTAHQAARSSDQPRTTRPSTEGRCAAAEPPSPGMSWQKADEAHAGRAGSMAVPSTDLQRSQIELQPYLVGWAVKAEVQIGQQVQEGCGETGLLA